MPEFKIYEKKGSAPFGIIVNNQFNPASYTANEKFREALAIAINREEIRDFVFEGMAVPAGSGPGYGSWALGYKPVPLVPYDPDKAKQLLQEAFPGKELFVNIYSFPVAGVSEVGMLAQAIAGYWEKVGVKSRIISMEYTGYRAMVVAKDPRLDNSVGVMRFGNRLDWTGSYEIINHSEGLISISAYPELDALIEALTVATDPEVIGQRMYDVAKYLRDHYSQIGLMEVSTMLAADPEKVPEWPNVSIPLAYDLYYDDIYTR